jgi:hypothetical protein
MIHVHADDLTFLFLPLLGHSSIHSLPPVVMPAASTELRACPRSCTTRDHPPAASLTEIEKSLMKQTLERSPLAARPAPPSALFRLAVAPERRRPVMLA